jgi:hypothetical protein
VPLVADRPAIVRAFVGVQESSAAINGVTAKLHAARNGTELANSPLSPFNQGGKFNAPLNPSRANLNDSLNFQLPSSWLTVGALTLWLEVNPDRSVTENNYGDNRSQNYNVTFQTVRPLEVVLIPIAYQRNGQGQLYRPSLNAQNNYGLGMLQQIYPIANLQYTIHSEYFFGGDMKTDKGWSDLLKGIESLRSRERSNNGAFQATQMPKYYGVLPMEASFWGGLGYVPGASSIGLVDQDDVAAHEMGHNFGLPHVNSAACGANPSGPDPNYPYANGLIGNVGVDVYQHLLASATETKDLMSYCWPKWISDYHYLKIFNVLKASNRQSIAPRQLQAGWLISGLIKPDGTGQLYNAEFMDAAAVVQEPGEGLYQVELYDSSGGIQFRYNFNPSEVASEDETVHPAYFSVVVPQMTNLATIQLKQGATLLASLAAATTAPTFDVSQAAGSNGDPNEIALTWQVNGGARQVADTTINVRYSADNGQTWQFLAVGRTDSTLNLSKTQLPASSNGLIEVTAHNSTQATTKRLELGVITNKSPQVGIVAEKTVNLYAHEPLVLAGTAFDLEDGALADSAMIWSESTQGQLGTGPNLIVAEGFNVGTYTVKLRATDSQGLLAEDTVTVVVTSSSSKIYLPLIVK